MARLSHLIGMSCCLVGLVGGGVAHHSLGAQSSLTVRLEKWLQVQSLMGQVTFTSQGQSRSAKVGDRLQQVGDTITTATNARTTLIVDTNIGTVEVAEKTRLQVQALTKVGDQGRITRLLMPYGRARLRLRQFTSPKTRFEIETPTGVGAVRGTDFGITLQPGGKMSFATLDGAIESQAQGKTVAVPAGFQNFIMPGHPPTPPVPLRDNLNLVYDFQRKLVNGKRQITLVGQVDPVNMVTVNDQPQSTDEQGRFFLVLPAVSYPKVSVVIITPLGREKRYDLAF
ncbi:MAG: FecR family protein [Synechococcales bacterium]|nr:FecR family protein [Synechococcales bacterium]